VPPLIFLNELGIEATFSDPVVLKGSVKLTAGGEASRGAGICADFGFVHAGGGIFRDGGATFMTDSCNIAQVHVSAAGDRARNSDLAKVQAADALPEPLIHGSVSGAGALRTFHYRIRLASGERVSFAELGSGPVGVGAGRAIGTAARARGVLRFRPAAGPAGERTIVALVTRNGLPITELTVARFRAPAPGRPSAPGSSGSAVAIVSGRNVLGMTGPAATARVGPAGRGRPFRGSHR
jgi:hypothetical protein